MRADRQQAGFTLVELLVYMVLLGLMLTSIYSIFLVSIRASRVANATNNLQNAAQSCLVDLMNELEQSSSIQYAVWGYVKSGTQHRTPYGNVNGSLTDYTGTEGIVFISAYPPRTTGYDTSKFQLYGCPSPSPANGAVPGTPYWQKWVCYWYDSTANVIYRGELYNSTSYADVYFSDQAGTTSYASGLPSTSPPIFNSAGAQIQPTPDVFKGYAVNKRLIATDVNSFLTYAFSPNYTHSNINNKDVNYVTIDITFGEVVNSNTTQTKDNIVHLIDYVSCRGDS